MAASESRHQRAATTDSQRHSCSALLAPENPQDCPLSYQHPIPLLIRLWPLHANICLASKSYDSTTLFLTDRSTSSLINLSFTLNSESANNQSSAVAKSSKEASVLS